MISKISTYNNFDGQLQNNNFICKYLSINNVPILIRPHRRFPMY